MKIAIASGKGGTGKTTVSLNLALSLSDVQLFDCDVEEPNCNLFLGFGLEKVEDVVCPVPVINQEKCSICRQCSDFCRYNALAALPDRILFFPSLCHGCGGCAVLCSEKAIRESERSLGVIEKAKGESSPEFYRGLLNIGETMTSAVIKTLKKYVDDRKTAILDAPPGTACPVIASIGDVDYCVLVTESTPFGFHDLRLAVDVVRSLKVPFGVVINRWGLGDSRVEEYCKAEGISILLKIPNNLKIAELYSRGIPFVQEMPEWNEKFRGMFEAIKLQLADTEEART
ncbi:cell division ATPase MinD [Methanosarcina barkeri 3]|uniref:Cell division ATPase MinD n=1 Tax=Methanosarcina barkeri 3 TaxID=1434107 RepID=A0A0E3SNX7_METBA|nr:ATP-binding protein [Methanosarcina barkeri]AKB83123.1 cell division ATPase MinD [Methanosarcina barkeri 3]